MGEIAPYIVNSPEARYVVLDESHQFLDLPTSLDLDPAEVSRPYGSFENCVTRFNSVHNHGWDESANVSKS